MDKLAADKAAKEAEAWHTQKAKSLAKEKPKKPKKGPDSSMLCFNLEMRAQLLKENMCKVVVVGDGRAGKTSLLRRFRGEEFREDEESTCGVDSCTVELPVLRFAGEVARLSSSAAEFRIASAASASRMK